VISTHPKVRKPRLHATKIHKKTLLEIFSFLSSEKFPESVDECSAKIKHAVQANN